MNLKVGAMSEEFWKATIDEADSQAHAFFKTKAEAEGWMQGFAITVGKDIKGVIECKEKIEYVLVSPSGTIQKRESC